MPVDGADKLLSLYTKRIYAPIICLIESITAGQVMFFLKTELLAEMHSAKVAAHFVRKHASLFGLCCVFKPWDSRPRTKIT
jgi:hypothetical protein